MPYISIIIPTHNSENTVCQALDSICSQRFTDYEVLIIDNGSTDKTKDLLQPYISKHSCISIISERDKGVYDAMNKGIDLATGEWLYFFGSDDCLHDDTVLEDVARVLLENPADMIYGDMIALSDNKRYGGKFDILRLHTKGNLCHQTIFYRKCIFHRLGKYNLRYQVVSDWDFNIRCFRHPDIKTMYVDRVIVYFNDKTGISSIAHSDPFYKELPILYINQLMKSKVYKAATFVHKVVVKLRIAKPIQD